MAKTNDGPQKSMITTFSGSGDKQLRVVGSLKKDKTYTCYVITRQRKDGKVVKGTSQRGATRTGLAADEATKYLAKLRKTAEASGWKVATGGGGFSPKKDAFNANELPSA